MRREPLLQTERPRTLALLAAARIDRDRVAIAAHIEVHDAAVLPRLLLQKQLRPAVTTLLAIEKGELRRHPLCTQRYRQCEGDAYARGIIIGPFTARMRIVVRAEQRTGLGTLTPYQIVSRRPVLFIRRDLLDLRREALRRQCRLQRGAPRRRLRLRDLR